MCFASCLCQWSLHDSKQRPTARLEYPARGVRSWRDLPNEDLPGAECAMYLEHSLQ